MVCGHHGASLHRLPELRHQQRPDHLGRLAAYDARVQVHENDSGPTNQRMP
jgi:hypothetical protein